MKFFDRDKEIDELRKARELAKTDAQFSVVTGRRRIGKTTLIWKAYEDEPMVYFFVARKTEKELCEGYKKEIEEKLAVPILGQPQSFSEIFEFLLKVSKQRSFTLFIDEFQEFFKVNDSIYSDMQRLWDIYHRESHINLVVCGSIYTMMSKIFKDSKEPLYNRESRFMKIKPFSPSVIKEILKYYHPDYTNEDLLALFTFTGGVAKYIDLLITGRAFNRDSMVDCMINGASTFVNEGKTILIEEFGKDYTIYFSILSAIASGHTSRSEIENVVGKEIGGYLTRLEDHYELVTKIQPIFENNPRKNVKYALHDNFFRFWFRFIYKYLYMIEIEAFDSLKDLIKRDYDTFSGKSLERYFKLKLQESKSFTRIGSWWDRKGENEIDIVAENELTRQLLFVEVKKQGKNYDEDGFKAKIKRFFETVGNFPDYTIRLESLSVSDM